MQLGIVGLPAVGKTTLYNLLTETGAGAGVPQTRQINAGVARVPDWRIDWLAELFQPRKVTHATIGLTDIPGIRPGDDNPARVNSFFEGVREADALVLVVRAFENEALPPALADLRPELEADALVTEMLVADLDRVESLLPRLEKRRRQDPDAERQLRALETCLVALEEDKPLALAGLTESEQFTLRGFQLLTLKPCLLAANLGESELRDRRYPSRDALSAFARDRGMSLLEFSGPVEQEISALPPDDRKLFMDEYGIQEAGIDLVARTAYEQLGLRSFFTVGEDEVRAWTIKQGTTAKEAGGKIHSDIERGFIRAEVASFKDLYESADMKALRNRGKLRLEGKTYIVQDGDIINFRFNV